MSLVGRTFPSADGVATATLFLTRDDGTFYVRRPQDVPEDEYDELAALGRQHRFTEMYERMRVRLSDQRTEIAARDPVHPAVQQMVNQRARLTRTSCRSAT